jgi:hypothetical protein
VIRTKTLEIRDRGTLIPALAIRPDGQHWLEQRGGHDGSTLILMHLDSIEAHSDPYDWNLVFGRTMRVAHNWLIENWGLVEDGMVVDVEYILGEHPMPKDTENPEINPPAVREKYR